MTAVLSGLFVAYLLLQIVAVFAQRSAYFPGQFMTPQGSGTPPAGFEVLWHDIGDGERVEAWFALPDGASPDTPAPLVVFLHGNGEFIDDNGWWVGALYRPLGCAVLLVEYRGYGRSGGSPSEGGIAGDVMALIDRVSARGEVDAEALVVHGRSIGGGIGARIIAERTPRAVILQSTFTSMAGMLTRHGVLPFLARDPMRIDRAIAAHDGPVLIMHGSSDQVIPISHAHRLRELAQQPIFLEGNGGHDDLPVPSAEYKTVITRYLIDAGVVARRE